MHKRKGLLKVLMLGIIISRGEAHGYEIYRELVSNTQAKWRPSIGTIYRLLSEMEEEGLTVKKTIYRGRRRIVVYSPTSKGINEFLRVSDIFMDKVLHGTSIILEVVGALKNKNIAPETLKSIEEKLLRLNRLLNEKLSSIRGTYKEIVE